MYQRERYLDLIERQELCFVLDENVRKFAQLFLTRLQLLNQRLDELIEHEKNNFVSQKEIEYSELESLSAYTTLGDELLELYAFMGANITTFRQALIRYDCLLRAMNGPPLGQWYVVRRRRTISKSKNPEDAALFEAVFSRYGLTKFAHRLDACLRHRELEYLNTLLRQVKSMERVILRAEREDGSSSFKGPRAFLSDKIFKLQYYLLAGGRLNELMLQPSFIRTRGAKLKKEIKHFADWRLKRNEFAYQYSHEYDTQSTSFMSMFTPSLWLTFASQMLYMMNHYIIEPSSTNYIHELGGNDALSGLLIGVAPWAALIAAFVYSLWSNHNFRHPLLCSAVFLSAGSFTYASAYKFNSIPMAMAGRFLSGLGAPCGVNIRIIADTVPSRLRTPISLMFMTTSALGQSIGPGAAVLLDYMDVDIQVPVLGRIVINGMTGPGYLMTILWLIYFAGLLIYFEDKERVGLQEIIERTLSNDSLDSQLDSFDGSSSYLPPTSDPSDLGLDSPLRIPLAARKTIAGPPRTINASISNIEKMPIQDNSHYSAPNASNSIETEDVINLGNEEKGTLKSRGFNEATIICMILKFVGKFVIEVLGCSVSLLTTHRYGWTVKNIGALSFVNGCLVIPISTTVGFLSHHYNDRQLLVGLLCIGTLGTLLLVDFSDFGNDYEDGYNDGYWYSVGPSRYVCGIILEFCGYQAAQSVVLSILSKVVPLSLAKGTFNSGFIATSITTLARANGDVFITIMGLVSIRQLLNLLAVPSVLLSLFSLMLSQFHGHKLSV
eukprot:CAMPEP_0194082180 /NCGR_PEP_ID=MMETSP0149-20130528/7761_1 /TAXON_ID=122233 /ORGANISM="Chaetoceros debilis, Strain MM31A-1" /LENGTH=778 /DNA_ID=CAMNT_0038764267 /DNA_START=599 /DNA_END=2935 /DNA_ORIENTATION=+